MGDRGQDLLRALDRHGIRTLEDIRKAGGISHLTGLPVAADHPTVKALEAQANLSILSSDVQVNVKLVEAGYTNIANIASKPVGAFVETTQGVLGADAAVQLHREARAKKAVLDNILTLRRLDVANGYAIDSSPTTRSLFSFSGNSAIVAAPTGGSSELAGRQTLPESQMCECSDCDAAVSPRAYLAELLAYAINWRLWKPGSTGGTISITLDDLVATLHQPFDDLPASCTAVDEPVRQVRICVEVLRDLGLVLPEAAERKYRIQAYTQLLTRIGTSYEELRRARSNEPEQRQALADRLGIDLTIPRPPGGDELDQILLDPNAQSPDPPALTEHVLERLFGLADTMRNPLSNGAKLGDEQGQITHWELSGAAWGRNTDQDGMVYGKLDRSVRLDRMIQHVQIDLYKDRQRQHLVKADLLLTQIADGFDPPAPILSDPVHRLVISVTADAF